MFTDIDCSRVTPTEAVGVLLDVRREVARLQAVQAELLVTAAGLVPQIEEFVVLVPMSDQERSIRIQDGVREELAAALRETPSTMQGLIDTARTLVTVVPEVLAALRAGDITLAHARHLADAAFRADLRPRVDQSSAVSAELFVSCLVNGLSHRTPPGGSAGSVRFVQTPLARAFAGDQEEDEAIERSQLALVHDRKELRSHLELPVELEIGHRHLSAAEEGSPAGLEPQHDR